jgi:hypothetical protein
LAVVNKRYAQKLINVGKGENNLHAHDGEERPGKRR